MSHEVKPMRSHADAETSTVVNGGNSPNHYSPNHDYNGHGGSVARFITPGGNPIDNTQPAFPGTSGVPLALNHFHFLPSMVTVMYDLSVSGR